MNKKLISLLLGTMCLLLTLGICIQIKTIDAMSNKSITKTATENELRDSVLREKEKYDNTYSKVEKLEKELAKLREKAAENSAQSQELQDNLKKYNNLLGYTELKGKGITITLKDGSSETLNQKMAMDYIVHDGDIVQVINALRNAGAEAISVNGQRIVNTSGVKCIGNVVTVNDQRIGTPFNISAIGSPEMLYGALNIPGGYISILKRAGVEVEMQKENNIIIPKYEGVYNYTYMKTVE